MTFRRVMLCVALASSACFTKPDRPSGTDADVTGDGTPGRSPRIVADNHGNNLNASTLSLPIRVPAGDALFVLAGIHLGRQCTDGIPNVLEITATGNVPFTRLESIAGSPCGPGSRSEHWGLVAPPVGDIDITFVLDGPPQSMHVVAVVVDHVNQTTPTRLTATNTGRGVDSMIRLDSAPDELVIDSIAHGGGIEGPGANQQRVFTMNQSATTTLDNSGASARPGAATVVMMWQFGSDDEWHALATSIKPP